MAEVTTNGYQSLRDYIEANWIYHSLRDGVDGEIIRLSTGDARTSWTHTAGDQVLELTTTVAGSDSDIIPPQAFAGSELYDVSSAGSPYADETFEAFTIETDTDELTVKHRIEVPAVV
jgi:hypothetical protein